MLGIYKITNPKNKIYIGQSTDLERREKDYRSLGKFKSQTKLFRSVKKYGWENHLYEIIEFCENEFILNDRERYWQEYYNSILEGLNCRLTGTNDKSGCLSISTRNKISKSLTNKILSQETKDKISKSNSGKVRTEE